MTEHSTADGYDDLADAAALLGYTLAGDRPAGQELGRFVPGPDTAADAFIDRLLWEASLLLWRSAAAAGGSPLPEAQGDSRRKIATACAAWRASGREASEWFATGLHPAQRIAVERFHIIAQRAGAGQPLCPEYDDL